MTLDFTSLTMVKVVGKFNGVAVPVQPIRERDAEFGSTLYAKILNMSGDSKVTPPKEGTKGVVIQRNKDDQQQVFWLGALVTSAADEQENAAILSKDNASVSVHENGFNVSHSGGGIDQKNNQTKITILIMFFWLSEAIFLPNKPTNRIKQIQQILNLFIS